MTGRTDKQHLRTLEIVLERLHRYGLRLKRGKCSFMQPSVQYLGYVIDKEGLHTTTEKEQAILNSPIPKDVQQLRSFLGLVNYGKFIPNLSTIVQPLNQLLCKNVPWKWTGKYQATFETLKEKLASSEVLVHYDPDLPLKLDCDASAYGIGAVLSHTFPNGEEKPIAYASRTLSKAERGYSQLEKEALSLIYGVKKYHQYLYGRRFFAHDRPQAIADHPGSEETATYISRRATPAVGAYVVGIRCRHISMTFSSDQRKSIVTLMVSLVCLWSYRRQLKM